MAYRSNLNDIDATVQDALELHHFKGKFSAKDFIEAISGPSLQDARNHPKEFDPKPFIRTFERSLEELLKQRRKLQRQTDDLEDGYKASESGHAKKLGELNKTFEDVYQSFENLEGRINEVGNTAIRIGEQLETIDKQRTRALEAKDLITFFMEFSKGRSERLEDMRMNGSLDSQYKAATIARRLNTVAREVDIPGTESARAGIEQYCEVFEKDLLEKFDAAYRNGDIKSMSHCALTLLEFNGGHSCVQTYVNQHEFFISRLKINESEDLSFNASLVELANPNAPAPPPNKSLLTLCDEIYDTIKHEWDIISMVFPNPIAVMQVFIQRVFAQSLQNHLESTVSRADSQSALAFLRVLTAAHLATAALVDELKKLDKNVIQPKLAELKTKSVNSDGTPIGARADVLSEILDHCMQDLFVPYLEGDRYVEKEKKALAESFGVVLQAFNNYQTQRKASGKNKNLLSRTIAQVQTVQNAPPASPMRSDAPAGAALMASTTRLLNMMSSGGPMLTMEDGMLDPNVCLRLQRIQAEAVSRCIEVSGTVELPRNVSILFRALLECLGSRYIDITLDAALEDITPTDSKTEPEVCSPLAVQQANNPNTPHANSLPNRDRTVDEQLTDHSSRSEHGHEYVRREARDKDEQHDSTRN